MEPWETPGGIGAFHPGTRKIKRGEMTDDQILESLEAQRGDPDRDPTAQAELEREIQLVQARRGGGMQQVSQPQEQQVAQAPVNPFLALEEGVPSGPALPGKNPFVDLMFADLPEDKTKPPPDAEWSDVARAIGPTAMAGLKESTGGIIELAGDLVRNEGMSSTGAMMGEEARKSATTARPEGEMSFWQRAVLGGISSVMQQLPTLAASLLTGNPIPALAGAGALAGGSSYSENRAAGLSGGRAAAHSTLDTAIEVVAERIPVNFLLKSIGRGTDVTSLVIGLYAREVPTEILTTAVQSANAKFSHRPDMTLDEYWNDISDTIGSTIVSTPITAGTAAAIGKAVGPNQEPAPAPSVVTGSLANDNLNRQLTQPSIDLPTQELDSATREQLTADYFAIDPEALTADQLEKSNKEAFGENAYSNAPPLDGAEFLWSNLSLAPEERVDIGELGATKRQADNAEKYLNPNTGDRLDRQFSMATDTAVVGLTPRQVAPKAGTYVLGQPSEDRPADMLQSMMETVEEWRQQYIPQASIVLSNEQLLTDSALGWHHSMGDNKHLIVPSVLRRMTDPSKFNKNTQAGVFYTLSHEFGHALFLDRVLGQVGSSELAQQIRIQGNKGTVSSEVLAQLPPDMAAMIAEFNEIRQRIENDSINAGEFVERWIGPAKMGREYLKDLGVDVRAPAKQVRDAIVSRAVERARLAHEKDGQELRAKLETDFFSLEEYVAEQASRYAYAKKMDQKSPMMKVIGEGLDALRKFFGKLKADGIVAPGVKFSEWMDGLSQHLRLADEDKRVVKARQNAGKRKVKPKAPTVKVTTKKAKEVATRVRKVGHNVKGDTKTTRQQAARKVAVDMVRTGMIDQDSNSYKDLMQHIKNEEWEEAEDIARDFGMKTVKFQPNSDLKKDPDWDKRNFSSPRFKAWFGDWERNPEEASVAREGAFTTLNDGTMVFDKSTDGRPLVSFASLERLQGGQKTFYVSTLRSAHFTEAMLGERNDPSMVPVVLNVRNPYIVASLTDPAPSIAELSQQGYDGIVYRNDLYGDTTFVVFDQKQIKMLPNRKGVNFDIDFDMAASDGRGSSKIHNAVKNFVPDARTHRHALQFVTRFSRYVLGLQQQARIRPHIEELKMMMKTNTDYNTYGASRRAGADEIVDRWQRLGKDWQVKLNRALVRHQADNELWLDVQTFEKERNGKPVTWHRYVMTEKALAELRKDGIDNDDPRAKQAVKLFEDVNNAMLDMLEEDQMVLLNMYQTRHAHQPLTLRAEEENLAKRMQVLRSKPFFPLGRFGRFMLVIQRPREDGKGTETIFREQFESRSKWEEATEQARKTLQGDEIVIPREIHTRQQPLLSLYGEMFDRVAEELDLNEDEVKVLREVVQPSRTDRLLSVAEQSQRGLKGYSSDALRSFANYTWHHSNAQAKMLYRGIFNQQIERVRSKLTDAQLAQNFPAMNELKAVLEQMEGVKEYIMAPPNEAHTARALVSLTYLGLNVKTAVLNLYGLITVWSDLTSKVGLREATRLVGRSFRLSAMTLNPKDLDKRRPGDYLDPVVQELLDRAIKEGVLSQSYAYHLAGLANQGTLARMGLDEFGGKITQKVFDIGMWPFRLTELTTRRVAFLAELQQQLDKNVEKNEAYTNAVALTNELQNDYSHGNRPAFMRGYEGPFGSLVPMATVFMSFAQHMAFHGYGGYELGQRRSKMLELEQLLAKGEITKEDFKKMSPSALSWGYGYTARIWMLTLLMAGYEGLPGMENILDLLDILWRKVGKKPIRQELREAIQAMDGDPQFWARGLGHDVLGFDISRSVGFGRIVPGTDELAKGADRTPEETVGGLAFNMFGATGGLMKWGLTAVGNDKPFSSQLEKFPGGIGNIWSAYQWWAEGGPEGHLQNKIALERQPDGSLKPRDLNGVEIMGKALGFNPEVVSSNREIMWQQYDLKMYWQSKATGLRRDYRRAWADGDREALNDAKKAISEFNSEVRAYPELRTLTINGKSLQQTVKKDQTQRRLLERGIPVEKKYRPSAEAVRSSFEPREDGP